MIHKIHISDNILRNVTWLIPDTKMTLLTDHVKDCFKFLVKPVRYYFKLSVALTISNPPDRLEVRS